MTLIEIKKNLSRNDITYIAKKLGFSHEMVRLTLRGERNNERIIEAAIVVAKNNQSLEMQLAAMAGV